MAQVRNIRPGYAVIRPNRERLVCKLTRLLVVAILLVSIGLMLAMTVGGWSKLQGMTPVNFVWCALYLVIAVFVLRWARGLLPIAAGMAVLALAVAIISALGLAGTSWYDRSGGAFGAAHALGGGAGLSASLLGTFTVLLAVVEALLILVAIVGFAQRWNVELEVGQEEARRRGSRPVASGPPATAA